MRKVKRSEFIPIVILRKFKPPLKAIDIPESDLLSDPSYAYLLEQRGIDPNSVRYNTLDETAISALLKSSNPVLDYAGTAYAQERHRIKERIRNYKTVQVTAAQEEAPELLSYIYYATTDLWWVIMLYNGFTFPDELIAGTMVKIPDLSEVKGWLSAMKDTSNTSKFSFKGTVVEI